jgi:regulator of cell morphogenesis and NO signaling
MEKHYNMYLWNSEMTSKLLYPQFNKIVLLFNILLIHSKIIPKLFLMLFKTITEEMTAHMFKEEMILFPRIKEVAASQLSNQPATVSAGYLSAPISVMEHEHDQAGEIMYKIRQLTHNYTPPAGACTTFRLCLNELKTFEEDLHRHVHLENNILFPMSAKNSTTQTITNVLCD